MSSGHFRFRIYPWSSLRMAILCNVGACTAQSWLVDNHPGCYVSTRNMDIVQYWKQAIRWVVLWYAMHWEKCFSSLSDFGYPPLHMGLSKNGVYIIILYCIYPNHGHFMGNMTHDDSPSKIGCILFSDKPPWKIDPKQILLVRSGILKEESARWFWLVYPPRPKMGLRDPLRAHGRGRFFFQVV